MPHRFQLVCVGDPERGTFFKRLCNDLQSDWEVVLGKAAREGNGRQPGEIKRIGKARAQVLFIWVYGFKSLRWTRRSRRDEDIDAREVCADLFVQHGPSSQSCYVVRCAQKRAFEHSSTNRTAEFLRRFLKSFFVVSVGLSRQNCLVGFASQ